MLRTTKTRVYGDEQGDSSLFCFDVFTVAHGEIFDSIADELASIEQATASLVNTIPLISSQEGCAKIEELYRSKGYFCSEYNRFNPDFSESIPMFWTHLRLLGYGDGGKRILHGRWTSHAKALRGALNSGILSVLFFDGLSEEVVITILRDILLDGVISPYRLGQILYWNPVERGILGIKSTLKIPAIRTESESEDFME